MRVVFAILLIMMLLTPHTFVSQHIDAGTLLQLADGSSLRCDVVVGADGANSMVAQHLGLQQPNYAGYVAYRCEKIVIVA